MAYTVSFEKIKNIIDKEDFSFYMRNRNQQDYHPDNIPAFTDEKYKIAYTLQDMACLCTSPELSDFIADVAYRLRDSGDRACPRGISQEELNYTIKFIRKGRSEYLKSEFVDLEALDSIE